MDTLFTANALTKVPLIVSLSPQAHRMSEQAAKLHFENAPVIEMVQALFFAAVPGWDLLDFGLLSKRLEPRYPKHEFKPPLGEPQQLQDRLQTVLQKQNFGSIPVRCWFVESAEAEIVQVQDNCLIHNWRKVPPLAPYPGYESVHSNFVDDWRTFCSFLHDRKLHRPELWKCELTYIDQFLRGSEWENFADLSKVYRLWRGMESTGHLSSVEFATFQVTYGLRGGTTKLLFSSQPAVRPDGKEVIQLTVTASARPLSSEDDDIFRWFEQSHDDIREGFLNFTTPEMHDYWRRKQ